MHADSHQPLAWFRMTNKNHCQEMAVTHTRLRNRMKPDVQVL